MADGQTDGYPKRPPYFAHRVVRLAFKTCLAQEAGPTPALLVVFVAHTEDAKHYTAPPTFYNDQLLAVLGLRKWEALDAARRAAVAAGWLHYEAPPRGARSRPGVYWTMVPERFAALDDNPSDEHYDDTLATDTVEPKRIRQTGTVARPAYPHNGYGAGYSDGDSAGYSDGYSEGEPSSLSLYPVPDPVPKRAARAAFVPPTLEQVREYCRQRKNAVDHEQWHAHYTANGWRVGRNPMKDWRAAVRTWERNGLARPPNRPAGLSEREARSLEASRQWLEESTCTKRTENDS